MLTIEPPRRHAGEDRLDAVQRAGGVDGHDAVEVRRRDVADPGTMGDAGGVDEAVDALERGDEPRPALGVGDIEPPLRRCGDVGADHGLACLAQELRRRGADAARRPGDDDDSHWLASSLAQN